MFGSPLNRSLQPILQYTCSCTTGCISYGFMPSRGGARSAILYHWAYSTILNLVYYQYDRWHRQEILSARTHYMYTVQWICFKHHWCHMISHLFNQEIGISHNSFAQKEYLKLQRILVQQVFLLFDCVLLYVLIIIIMCSNL